jgi:hypothetical protein
MRSKYKILLVSLLFLSLSGFSQRESNWTIDIGLTQTYPGFFILYNGSVDIGAGYNTKLTGDLFGGGSFEVQFLKLSGTQSRTTIYKPKLNLHYRFKVGKSFSIIPWFSVGYSFLNIKNTEYNYADTQSGLNISPELKLLWNTQTRIDYYFYGRYDYIKLSKDAGFTHLKYYRNIDLTSFGIGILIKQKEHELPEKYK